MSWGVMGGVPHSGGVACYAISGSYSVAIDFGGSMNKVQILRAQAYSAAKVSGVLDEATRKPEASKHVANPKPPKWLVGSRERVDAAVDEYQAKGMQLVHMADGTVHQRKRRKDARCLVAGIASHPLAMEELNRSNADGVTDWIKDTVIWLKAQFGKQLKGCVVHFDESHPHLHYFVVGDAQRLHPGLKNEVKGKTRIGDPKARMLAHKEGLKAFLNDYHAKVGSKHGMVRSLGSKPAWRIRDRGIRQQIFDLDKRIVALESNSEKEIVLRTPSELEAIASVKSIRDRMWDEQRKINRPEMRY